MSLQKLLPFLERFRNRERSRTAPLLISGIFRLAGHAPLPWRTTLFRIPRERTHRKNAETSAGMKEGCAETEVESDLARSSQGGTTSACLHSAQLCMSNSKFVVRDGNIKKGSCGPAPSCSAAVPVA